MHQEGTYSPNPQDALAKFVRERIEKQQLKTVAVVLPRNRDGSGHYAEQRCEDCGMHIRWLPQTRDCDKVETNRRPNREASDYRVPAGAVASKLRQQVSHAPGGPARTAGAGCVRGLGKPLPTRTPRQNQTLRHVTKLNLADLLRLIADRANADRQHEIREARATVWRIKARPGLPLDGVGRSRGTSPIDA